MRERPHVLMLGELEVGILETMNVDGFWCYGRFREGKDFLVLAVLLQAMEEARSRDDADAVDSAQQQIEDLGLEQTTSGGRMPISGFKLTDGEYEFRV